MIKNTYLLFLLLLFGITGVRAQTVQIENVVKAPGDIAVKVEMLGFTGSNGSLQSIQFQIAFDDHLFFFKGISNVNANFPGWVIPTNGSSSPITLSYVNITGKDINTKIFDLNFGYAGGFSGSINFIQAGCEIARGGLITMNNVTYINGSVAQTASVASANLGATQQAAVTGTVIVPVNLQGAGLTPFNAFTFVIGFNPAKLTYVETINSTLGGTLVESATSGVLTLTWNGSISSLPIAHVFDLKFTYNGGGDAAIDFMPGSQIMNPSLAIIPTTYTGMLVQNSPGSSSISMPNLGVALSTPVSVPITLNYAGSGFVGGVNLKIGYNTTYLVYNGFNTGTLGSGITATASGGVITIGWVKNTNTANLNGVILTLNFTSTASMGSSSLTFNAGSTVTQTDLANVVLTYNNGSVAVGTYSISGMLKYANTSGPVRPITNSTVYLKTANGLTTLATTTSDASGNFTFTGISNGSYKLDASTTKAWCGSVGVTLADYAIVKTFVNTSIPFLAGIYWLAADVNHTSTVTLADYALIKTYVNTSSLTGWYTPGWIFVQTSVTVLNANVTNMDIIGICSGDVNASYTPPL